VLERVAPLVLVAGLAGIATSSTGCTLVSIEASVEEACLTHQDLEVERLPDTPMVATRIAFDDLGGLGDLADLADEVRFVRFGARGMAGVHDLGFIDAATVTIASGDPDSTLPSLVVYDCAGDCTPDGVTLSVPAQPDTDAIAFIRESSLVVDVELHGEMPTSKMTLAIDVCVTGTLSYELAR